MKKRMIFFMTAIMALVLAFVACDKNSSNNEIQVDLTLNDWKIKQFEEKILNDVSSEPFQTLTTITSDTENWTRKIQLVGTDSISISRGIVNYSENYFKFNKQNNFEKNYVYQYINEIELNEDGDILKYRYFCCEKIQGTYLLEKNENDYKLILDWKFREFREKVDSMVILYNDDVVPIWNAKSDTVQKNLYSNEEKSEVWELTIPVKNEIQIEQQINNSQTNIIEKGYRKYILKR